MAFYILNNEVKLSPTEKLWIEDPYLTECEATVLHSQQDLLVTDKTIFYAESGGQVADQGVIDDVGVIDVQKQPGTPIHIKREDVEVPTVQVNTVVVHKLDRPSPFTVGDKVKMHLDWPYRYQLMRHHSASHFVFHAIEQIFGDQEKLYVKGCYIYDQSARFDYANKLDPKLIPEVSALANNLIAQGGEIIMEPDPQTKEISYWRYGNEIIIPCGGTHVRSAQEIGEVSIKRKSHGKTTDRIYLSLLSDV